MHTSPNAPFPITFTVRKSSNPSLVLRSRRKVDSFFPSCCSWRSFLSSVIVLSACNFRSSSTRLGHDAINHLDINEHEAETHTFGFSRWLSLQRLCRSVQALVEHPLPLGLPPQRNQQSNGRSKHSPPALLNSSLSSLQTAAADTAGQAIASPRDTAALVG